MKVFTLAKDAFTLSDEPHPDYGYSYRAFVREGDLPIQFSSKRTNYLEGTMITAKTSEEKTAKSSGKPYLWLTGVSIVEDDSGQGDTGVVNKHSESPSPSAKVPEKAATVPDSKFLKDISDYHERILKSFMQYEDYQKIKTHEDYRVKFLEFVDEMAWWLHEQADNMRSGKKPNEDIHDKLERGFSDKVADVDPDWIPEESDIDE